MYGSCVFVTVNPSWLYVVLYSVPMFVSTIVYLIFPPSLLYVGSPSNTYDHSLSDFCSGITVTFTVWFVFSSLYSTPSAYNVNSIEFGLIPSWSLLSSHTFLAVTVVFSFTTTLSSSSSSVVFSDVAVAKLYIFPASFTSFSVTV